MSGSDIRLKYPNVIFYMVWGIGEVMRGRVRVGREMSYRCQREKECMVSRHGHFPQGEA